MYYMVVRNLKSRKEQVLLVLAGAVLIALGFGIFSNASASMSLTADRSLSEYWRTTYDILVRAPESVTMIEREYGLVRPNHLSGTPGGITLQQWEQIKAIPEVEVAAPIAMLGYVDRASMAIGIQDRLPLGIYRVTASAAIQDGDHTITATLPAPYYGWYGYFTKTWGLPEEVKQERDKTLGLVGIGAVDWHGLMIYTPSFNDKALLAAIDPEEEARLVHLDEMLVPLPGKESQYLQNGQPILTAGNQSAIPVIPILMNQQDYVQQTLDVKVEWVDILPIQVEDQLAAYLDIPDRAAIEAAPRETVFEDSIPLDRKWANLQPVVGLRGGQVNLSARGITEQTYSPLYAPSPVAYRVVQDPPDSLPAERLVLEALPTELTEAVETDVRDSVRRAEIQRLVEQLRWHRTPEITFRSLDTYLESDVLFEAQVQGAFEIDRLKALGGAAPNQVPLETYLVPQATLLYDEEGQPLDTPVTLNPTLNKEGYLVSPPDILMSLDQVPHLFNLGCARHEIDEDKPLGYSTVHVACEPEREDYISAIRVVVRGIEAMDGAAQAKIERVAQEIVKTTGLHVDIMVGSSPEPVLVHLPGYGDVPGRGYVEELWVKKNVSTQVQSGLNRADGLLFGGMLVSCLLFLFNGNYLAMLGRMGEFGLLKAVGWRGRTLAGLLLGEGLGMGLLAGLLAAGMVWGTGRLFELPIDGQQLLGLIPLGGLVFVLGLLLPAYQAGRLAPVAAMKAGETASRTPKRKPGLPRAGGSFLGYALSGLLRRPGRTFFSLLGLALGSGMLALLALVLQGMQGELYGTLLGMWIRTQIQPYHWLMGGVGLVVSAFGVADILLLNLRERRGEIGLLSAIGWRRGDLFRLFLVEGALLGLSGGLLGLGLGLGLHALLGSGLSGVKGGLLLGVGVALPVGVTLLATLYPAARAARLLPLDALRGEERLSSERPVRAYLVYGGLGVVLLGLVLYGTGQAWQGRAQPAPPPAAVILTATPTPTLPPPKPWVEPTPVNLENLPQYELYVSAFKRSDLPKNIILENIHWINNTGEALDDLVLRLYANVEKYDGYPEGVLSVETVRINNEVVSFQSEAENTAVRIFPEKPIQPGQRIWIQVVASYEKVPFAGFPEDVIVLRSFFPLLAIYEGDDWRIDLCEFCADTVYSQAAELYLKVTAPPDWVVAASGEETTQVRYPHHGTIGHVFKISPARDLALVLSPRLRTQTTQVGDTELSVAYLEGNSSGKQIEPILATAAEAFGFFQDEFGPYPYPTLTMFAFPFASSTGTEYPGFVVLSFKEGDEDLSRVIAHEIAHQWWYGVVGNDTFREPWLDEALAEYSALLYMEKTKGRQAMEDILNVYEQDALRIDAQRGQPYPVGSSVWDFPGYSEYAAVVYRKGPLFLDALRNQIGEQAFQEGLRQYFEWYRFGVGSGQSFLEAMQQASGQDLRSFFADWVG